MHVDLNEIANVLYKRNKTWQDTTDYVKSLARSINQIPINKIPWVLDEDINTKIPWVLNEDINTKSAPHEIKTNTEEFNKEYLELLLRD